MFLRSKPSTAPASSWARTTSLRPRGQGLFSRPTKFKRGLTRSLPNMHARSKLLEGGMFDGTTPSRRPSQHQQNEPIARSLSQHLSPPSALSSNQENSPPAFPYLVASPAP